MTKSVNKVTVASILKKKKIMEEVKTTPFYSEVFQGEIDIDDVSPAKIMEIIQGASEDEPLRADYELIYACCPVFRDKELQTEYEVEDPIDIVGAIYKHNLIEPSSLAKHILKRYGFYLGEGSKTIKKL